MGHACKTFSGNVAVSIPTLESANGYDDEGKEAISLTKHLQNNCPNTSTGREYYVECRDEKRLANRPP